MKKTIYLVGFSLLTAADCILGYKTAVSSFGIESTWLALLWAGGFSMMSIPLKLIYDRVIEKTYGEGNEATGQGMFLAFSVLWVWIAYQAFAGVGELRKLDSMSAYLKPPEIERASTRQYEVTGGLSDRALRLARTLSYQRYKSDSTRFSAQMAERAKSQQTISALANNTSSAGFLYINLLFILSAAVCLSMAFAEDSNPMYKAYLEQKKETDRLYNSIQKSVFGDNFDPNAPPSSATEFQVTRKDMLDELLKTYGDMPKPEFTVECDPPAGHYYCSDCEKTFLNRHSYNGHFNKNKVCQKGNFTII